jgi:type IV pilus assembly protein PilE
MNTWNVKKNSGFSMIELMAVIVIVAILVALAYPSYLQYIRKSKRGEAQQLLMNWSINQEIWRSNNPQYATLAQLAQPNLDYYTFTLPARSATVYTLQAAASGDQVNDEARDGTDCSPLTLTQNGVKSPAACWD